MMQRGLRSRFIRSAMVIAVGGSAFQLSGCDPAVRGTLLDGLEQTTQTLSTALISAYFITLQNDQFSDTGLNTVN